MKECYICKQMKSNVMLSICDECNINWYKKREEKYDKDGYDKDGVHRNGYDENGLDVWGFDEEGYKYG